MTDVEVLGAVRELFGVQSGSAKTYVDALVGEAGRYGRRLFFSFGKEDWELFDGRHGNVTSVVSGKKGLSN